MFASLPENPSFHNSLLRVGLSCSIVKSPSAKKTIKRKSEKIWVDVFE
jgi:hypothetical protein